MNTEIAVPETDGNLGPGLEQAQTYGHTIYAIYNIDIFRSCVAATIHLALCEISVL
jgi:hypothetical protein